MYERQQDYFVCRTESGGNILQAALLDLFRERPITRARVLSEQTAAVEFDVFFWLLPICQFAT